MYINTPFWVVRHYCLNSCREFDAHSGCLEAWKEGQALCASSGAALPTYLGIAVFFLFFFSRKQPVWRDMLKRSTAALENNYPE